MKRSVLVLALLAQALRPAAHAQTSWTLDGQGDWFDAAHWSAGVPDGSAAARINLGTVVLENPDAETSSLQIGQAADSGGRLEARGSATLTGRHLLLASGIGADASLLIQGGSFLFDAGEGPSNIWLGVSGRGELSILDGGIFRTLDSSIGRFGGAEGIVTVEGAGSLWRNGGQLIAGHLGAGALAVRDEGEVFAAEVILGFLADAVGSLTVASGGVLETGRLSVGSGSGGAVFDGGLLRVAENTPHASDFTAGFGPGGFVLATGGLTFDSNGRDAIVAAPLSGAGGLLKTGSGTLTLSGTNTYTGSTAVEEGTLRIADAGHMPDSAEFLADGGILDLRGVEGIAFSKLTIQHGGQVLNQMTSLQIADTGSSTVLVSGTGSLWDIAVASYFNVIGYSGNAAIRIEDGGRMNLSGGALNLAFQAGSTADIVIRGAGSELRCSASIFVGYAGTSEVRVEAGGLLYSGDGCLIGGWNASTGQGMVVVSGEGSMWYSGGFVEIGLSGASGKVMVEDGGLFRVDDHGRDILIGVNTGIGTMEVTGAGSRSEADILHVGFSGQGALAVRDGGVVSIAGASTMGIYGSSEGTAEVSGAGSLWEVGSALTVGESGAGTLVVAEGGLVTMRDGTLGRNAGASGAVVVTGHGSEWRSSEGTTVGLSGAGLLTVADGGRVSSATGTVGTTGQASITGADSIWQIAGDFHAAGTVTVESGGTLAVGGLLQAGGGALALRPGGLVSAVSVALDAASLDWTGGELRITGADGLTFDGASLRSGFLGDGQTLEVARRLTLSGANPLVLDGGILRAEALSPGGASLDWRGGEVHITGADGLITAGSGYFQNILLGAGRTLDVAHRLTVSPGDFLALSGGTLRAGELWLDGSAILISSGALDLDGIGLLGGAGSVLGRITGGSASTIRAAGGSLTLGNAGLAAAVQFEGALEAGGNDVLLLNATQTRLGHATTLEAGARLNAPNGLLLAGGSTLAATGEARIFGDFENQGLVAGPSEVGEVLLFYNNVTGGGDFFGNIRFLLEYAPGNSPGSVFFDGDVEFASSATLRMEIGGTRSGLEYDALVIGGDLLAGGTLSLTLLDGYTPAYGSSFQLFTWSTQSGWFDAMILPGLSEGLEWDASRLVSDGLISIVPEPSAGVLFLLGAGSFLLRRRRKEKAAPKVGPRPRRDP